MTLGFPNVKAGSFTSQAVSTVELPQGQWPELIESLLHFVHSPADTNLRHSVGNQIHLRGYCECLCLVCNNR